MYFRWMPVADDPIPPRTPARLPGELAQFVKLSAGRIFGNDAVVRSYGVSQDALRVHVEHSGDTSFGREELIGELVTRLDHIPHVEITRRGTKVTGDAKIAYRQGYIL